MGQDKAMLSWKGKTLLESAVELLNACCEETVICSSNPEHDWPGIRRISDQWLAAGPMAAIASAMEALPSSDLFLPVGVDQVGLTPDILTYLINAYQLNIDPETNQPRFDALAFQSGERLQPLSAVYHRRILPLLRDHIQREKLSLFRLFDTGRSFSWIPFEAIFPHIPDAFTNLNSPQDLNDHG